MAEPARSLVRSRSGESGLTERSDKISEIIARQIVRDIRTGRLQPGDRLPKESIMLERFGVGRYSLREALRILEVYGLISIKAGPSGGPVVQEVTARQYARTSAFYFHAHGATSRHLVEARVALEPLAARLAATNPSPEAIARLQRSIDDGPRARAAHEANDWETFSAAIGDFHDVILGMSDNPIINLVGQSVKCLYTERLERRSVDSSAVQTVLLEHEAIAQAIISGRPDRAELLMADHVRQMKENMMKSIPGLLDDVLDWR